MTNRYDEEPGSRNLYYVIPAEIMDSELSNALKLLYGFLSGFAHKNGDCYPSDKYLSTRLRCSEDNAGKLVGKLAKAGYISKVTIPHPHQPFHKIRIITIEKNFKKSLSTDKNDGFESAKNDGSEAVKNDGVVSEGTSNPPNPPKGGERPKESARRKPKTPEKKRFEDHVLMTDKEHETLVSDYGGATTKLYIQKLDAYIGSKGKKYKSHYKTIIGWLLKDNKTKNDTPQKPKQENSAQWKGKKIF